MAGSVFGKHYTVTTWGESHGEALGAVIDGCPAGLSLSEEDIQVYLDRRRPGKNSMTTSRDEADRVRILSGVYEGITTGTPISLMVMNTSQRSSDYDRLSDIYRPGHADYTFDSKYGLRDPRGGGRSSGRETIGRVAAGAVAAKILKGAGIEAMAYTRSLGPVESPVTDLSLRLSLATCMPDREADTKAAEYVRQCAAAGDSVGGVCECIITGVPAGIGETVFRKLDAELSRAVMSIGAVKAVEIGDGTKASARRGSENNDAFIAEEGRILKATNHSGGVLGGMSDGSDIILRAHFKATPSISTPQSTVNRRGDKTEIVIGGRHDPVIVPRAVVVVEAMCAITVLDLMFENMHARLDSFNAFYSV